MPDMFSARRRIQHGLGYLIGSAMLVAGIAACGTAQAAIDAPAAIHAQAAVRGPVAVHAPAAIHAQAAAIHAPAAISCNRMSGTTAAKPGGGVPSGGTTFTVHCANPTLLGASRVDLFKGWLLLKSGKWLACKADIYWPPCPPTHIVLCGGVTPGSQMKVVARNPGYPTIVVGV